MVSEKMEKALNGQLNAEVYSGYLYLSMAAYFEDEDLAGFANWMRVQAEEELEHGMKFYDYIIRRGASVTLTAIDGPQTEWDSPLAAFEHVLEHEKMVTGLINDLVNLAIEEKDHATNNFLQWFVEEQVEEEANVGGVLAQLEMIGDDKSGLFALDKELGARTFVAPVIG